MKRSIHLVNLDPAAEYFEYEPTIDIKNLITLEEVMQQLNYGPNGGLIYCLEYLLENLDWFENELQDYDDDNLIIDCPGQIELYTHSNIMRQLVECLHRLGYRVCGVYLLDSQFVQDSAKFFAGIMSAMSAMLQLGIPHLNVMTKMDLIDENDPELERFFSADTSLLLEDANASTRPDFHNLNQALVRLIDEYSMVNLIPLNIKDEDSIQYLLSHIDNAIQYGEDLEPKEVVDDIEDDE
ncbi:ATP binding protein [Boothiomyces sp. JEL0866]|nr:ATP binding protein [Boothiomyces sp. JEL0866]KAJ3324803.1 ATP binding protein [Boothiomyces sp. JEL0866]